MEHDELRERTANNRARTRELANHLARTADAIAATFERSANLHDAIAGQPRHPLFEGAAQAAERERYLAEWEREEAARFRRRG